ncbi:GcrA family cell cycle regulator [Aquabacter sp. CN5-332]|uniref:GcrA family cell cycle regulator n=1 Tax=Aquabacter sp. CN5-332 TaxID=3156608 RepID=UPI0032B356C8
MSGVSRGPWADEKNVAALRALVAEPLSAGEIASRLCELGVQVTRNAVIGKCERMGLRLHGAQGYPAGRPRRPKPIILSGPGDASPPAPGARRASKGRSACGPECPPRTPDVVAPTLEKSVPNDGVRKPPTPPARFSALFSAERPGVLLASTTGWQCRWPVDGEGLTLEVCGAKAPEGQSYCRRHHCMAYRPAGHPPRPPFDTSIARAPNRPRDGDLVDTIGEAA